MAKLTKARGKKPVIEDAVVFFDTTPIWKPAEDHPGFLCAVDTAYRINFGKGKDRFAFELSRAEMLGLIAAATNHEHSEARAAQSRANEERKRAGA